MKKIVAIGIAIALSIGLAGVAEAGKRQHAPSYVSGNSWS